MSLPTFAFPRTDGGMTLSGPNDCRGSTNDARILPAFLHSPALSDQYSWCNGGAEATHSALKRAEGCGCSEALCASMYSQLDMASLMLLSTSLCTGSQAGVGCHGYRNEAVEGEQTGLPGRLADAVLVIKAIEYRTPRDARCIRPAESSVRRSVDKRG